MSEIKNDILRNLYNTVLQHCGKEWIPIYRLHEHIGCSPGEVSTKFKRLPYPVNPIKNKLRSHEALVLTEKDIENITDENLKRIVELRAPRDTVLVLLNLKHDFIGRIKSTFRKGKDRGDNTLEDYLNKEDTCSLEVNDDKSDIDWEMMLQNPTISLLLVSITKILRLEKTSKQHSLDIRACTETLSKLEERQSELESIIPKQDNDAMQTIASFVEQHPELNIGPALMAAITALIARDEKEGKVASGTAYHPTKGKIKSFPVKYLTDLFLEVVETIK